MCSRSRIECALLTMALLVSCSKPAPPQQQVEAAAGQSVIDSQLNPGLMQPISTVDPRAAAYYNNAAAVMAGQRLFQQYNCSGCHSNGGGGMGPDLMDDQWIYGSRLEQIHQTLAQGRPNGMPAWGNKVPDQQLWQLAAYVRSMSLPATINAETGDTPSQLPAPVPPAVDATAGWAPPDDTTNHYGTTLKGP